MMLYFRGVLYLYFRRQCIECDVNYFIYIDKSNNTLYSYNRYLFSLIAFVNTHKQLFSLTGSPYFRNSRVYFTNSAKHDGNTCGQHGGAPQQTLSTIVENNNYRYIKQRRAKCFVLQATKCQNCGCCVSVGAAWSCMSAAASCGLSRQEPYRGRVHGANAPG